MFLKTKNLATKRTLHQKVAEAKLFPKLRAYFTRPHFVSSSAILLTKLSNFLQSLALDLIRT